jgi:glycosyltransferase involved in cell wall biosynthesis
VDLDQFTSATPGQRSEACAKLGIDPSHLVLGMVGSLKWTERQGYCYGLELVEALRRAKRTDVTVLIVGDGDGRPRLEARIPPDLRSRVVFTGQLAAHEIPEVLKAFDAGFVTQTLDGLGSYRLTTKLPEYLAAGVPVAMSPVPGYYDYVGDAGWALPAGHPAAAGFHADLATWIDSLERSDVDGRRPLARLAAEARFGYDALSRRFARFIEDVLHHVNP